MSSTFFKSAMATMAPQAKNLDSIQVKGGAYLGKGTHDVRIESVDSSKIADNKLGFTFMSEDKKSHNDNPFVMERDGTGFNYAIRMLLSGVIPSQEALDAFFALLQRNDKGFEYLTGAKLRIKLDYGKGFVYQTTAGGTYIVCDSKTGEPLEDCKEEFATIEDAKATAIAKGYKRAYLRIVAVEATHAESNIKSLLAAIAADEGASGSGSGTAGTNARQGKGTAAI